MGRVLCAAQIASYEEDGILFPVPALGPRPLAAFRAGFDAVAAQLGEDRRPERYGQWHLCFRWAYDLATYPPILNAVEDLLGPNLLLHSTTAFAKRPRSPEFVSWHQDGYNWQLDVPRLVSAWVALSESTPENGCLRVIPGSHRRMRMEHSMRPQKDNLLGTGLTVSDELDESRAVDVQLAAGEMSFHHVDIVHGSNPNRSDHSRIGFAVRYTTPEVSQQRSHHDVVLARGSDLFGHFTFLETPPCFSVADGLLVQRSLTRERALSQKSSSRRAAK